MAHVIVVDTESRSWLEREYLFIDVISTFLRAIRAGAITIHHGSVLLAHYGRLGVAFDSCVKVVVDVLREEGLAGENGEVITTVVTKAIQEVRWRSLFLSLLYLTRASIRHSPWFWTATSRTNTVLSNLRSFSQAATLSAEGSL